MYGGRSRKLTRGLFDRGITVREDAMTRVLHNLAVRVMRRNP